MIDALKSVSLRRYIESEQDRDNLWVFVHIPKTAGSSLGNEISARLRPYKNLRIDYLDNSRPHSEKHQASVNAFAQECRAQRFRSASGHITLTQALQIKAAEPRVRIFSMLRDPVARVISDYRYQRTPAHPLQAEFIAKYACIEDYVVAAGAQNKMCRFLAGDQAVDVERALRRVETGFTFLGTVEQYEMSFNVLFRLFGLDLYPKVHARKTVENEHNDVDVSAKLVDMIRACNAKDIAIYDMVHAMLERHRPEWEAMRAESRAA